MRVLIAGTPSNIEEVSPTPSGTTAQRGAGPPHFDVSKSHIGTPKSVGRLWVEWSSRSRDLYLTTKSSQNRFEHAIPETERPQNFALDRSATVIGIKHGSSPNTSPCFCHWNNKQLSVRRKFEFVPKTTYLFSWTVLLFADCSVQSKNISVT
jgi:hypothetical protein